MQGARCGTRSRDPGVTAWAQGRRSREWGLLGGSGPVLDRVPWGRWHWPGRAEVAPHGWAGERVLEASEGKGGAGHTTS